MITSWGIRKDQVSRWLRKLSAPWCCRVELVLLRHYGRQLKWRRAVRADGRPLALQHMGKRIRTHWAEWEGE